MATILSIRELRFNFKSCIAMAVNVHQSKSTLKSKRGKPMSSFWLYSIYRVFFLLFRPQKQLGKCQPLKEISDLFLWTNNLERKKLKWYSSSKLFLPLKLLWKKRVPELLQPYSSNTLTFLVKIDWRWTLITLGEEHFWQCFSCTWSFGGTVSGRVWVL